MTGLLPADLAEPGGWPAKKSKKKDDGKLLEKGMENVFVGLAFLVIFLGGLFYMRGAFFFWVWFIIPALAGFGEGLGQLLRSRREQRLLPAGTRSALALDATAPRPLFATPRAGLAARDTAEIVDSPFSVTEATTRHLKGRAGDAPSEF